MDPRKVGGDLPWGWHLVARGGMYEDEQGRRWGSIRDAFWQGKLGFPDPLHEPEQHELLLRVLASIDARRHGVHGAERDLFDGNRFCWRFYMCWVASAGLTEPVHRDHLYGAPLTVEGRSVLLMLQATRHPDWIDLPAAEIVDAIRNAGRGEAEAAREAALQAFERDVVRLRYAFGREDLNGVRMVTLKGVTVNARVPMRRVMWSTSIQDERTRDDFYAWLAERVDRWEDWGEIAYRSGADALTRHLFALFLDVRSSAS